jgi:hypothetical protein
MFIKGSLVWLASICIFYGIPLLAAYLYPHFYPGSGLSPAESVRNFLGVMRIFNYVFFFSTAIFAGWWIARIYRKDLGRKLGREVRNDIEATSISAWMEAAGKEEAAAGKKA